MTRGPWSPEEDEQLRKLAKSGFTVAEIASQMKGRSKSSIRSRAYAIGCAIARELGNTEHRIAIGLKAKGK